MWDDISITGTDLFLLLGGGKGRSFGRTNGVMVVPKQEFQGSGTCEYSNF